jgi:hypothetical protein
MTVGHRSVTTLMHLNWNTRVQANDEMTSPRETTINTQNNEH